MIPASTEVALRNTHDDQKVEAFFPRSFRKSCIQSAAGTRLTEQRSYMVDCIVGCGDWII
jgi:hypothetical protein